MGQTCALKGVETAENAPKQGAPTVRSEALRLPRRTFLERVARACCAAHAGIEEELDLIGDGGAAAWLVGRLSRDGTAQGE